MRNDGHEKILQAAKRVISEKGINGATMRGIAEEAGLSTGAIYHYYKNKEEVLYDVMDFSLSESKRMAEKTKLSTNINEIIDEIGQKILVRFDKQVDNRLQYYLAQEAMLGNEELIEKFKNKYEEWINRTQELMGLLYNKEQSKYSKALASLLIGAIDGVVLQLLLGANVSTPEDISKVYNYLLKEGIPYLLENINAKFNDET